MRIVVANAEQARAAVERFHAFHDGFVRRLTLDSHDVFEDRHTHTTTGLLDLTVLFARSNHDEGRPPSGQETEARFREVRDLRVRFTGEATDGPIQELRLDAGGARLRARMAQSRLVAGARWERAETRSFTFAAAEIREVKP